MIHGRVAVRRHGADIVAVAAQQERTRAVLVQPVVDVLGPQLLWALAKVLGGHAEFGCDLAERQRAQAVGYSPIFLCGSRRVNNAPD